MKNKCLAVCMAVMVLFGCMHGYAASFDDVGEAHVWAKADIESYAERGILAGDGLGRFFPDNSVTRAEFAKMLCLVFGLDKAEEITYTDVDKDSWQYDYIAKTDKYTYTEGKESYAPDKPATRAEIAYAIVGAAGFESKLADMPFTDADAIADPLKANATTAYALGLLKGYPDNTFRPDAPVTRAEVVVLLSRAEAALAEKPPKEEQEPLSDDEAVKLDVTELKDVTDEIEEINTLACVRAVMREVYLPGYQKPKACIKLYLPGTDELGCVFVDDLMVFKNGVRCDSELDCGDLVYFEKKFNGTIGKVHILWDMDDKGKKNGNDYAYSNVGYWTDTTKQTDERDWGGRGTANTDGKRYTNEFRILYTPNVTVSEKSVSIGGYAVPKETRVILYTRYTKDSERFRCTTIGEIDLTNPERHKVFKSVLNTPENMKLVKTFYLHWHENKLTDIVIVQDVKFV